MNTGFPRDGVGMIVIGFIAVVAVIIVGGIVFSAGKSLVGSSSNNAQPVLRLPAKIVARRTDVSVSTHRHHGDHHHFHAITMPHLDWRMASGWKFGLSDSGAGLLLEGDQAELTYQGTRYHGFARPLPIGAFSGRKTKWPRKRLRH
jgi:hypothetical protein